MSRDKNSSVIQRINGIFGLDLRDTLDLALEAFSSS